jgi:hypothetical protein
MNKEFIPYEQALALKELGFDEPCFGVYQPEMDGKYYLFSIDVDEIGSNNSDCIEFIKCTAPLYQQAFKWFREKYGYYYPIHRITNNTNQVLYSIGPYAGDYFTYEEAELECLVKLIEICKK